MPPSWVLSRRCPSRPLSRALAWLLPAGDAAMSTLPSIAGKIIGANSTSLPCRVTSQGGNDRYVYGLGGCLQAGTPGGKVHDFERLRQQLDSVASQAANDGVGLAALAPVSAETGPGGV